MTPTAMVKATLDLNSTVTNKQGADHVKRTYKFDMSVATFGRLRTLLNKQTPEPKPREVICALEAVALADKLDKLISEYGADSVQLILGVVRHFKG